MSRSQSACAQRCTRHQKRPSSATGVLTPSLPRCHFKTTSNSAKFENPSVFVFFFLLFFACACERIFIKTQSIESRCVIGPENTRLQARPCIIQPGNSADWGSERVNYAVCKHIVTALSRSVVALIRLEIAALELGPGKQPPSDRRQSKTRLASNGQKKKKKKKKNTHKINWINCCECVVDATLGNVYASYEVAIVGAFRWQAAQRKKLARV